MANPQSLAALLGPTALQTVAGLTALLFGGRILLRRVFEVVAASDNSETFVGLWYVRDQYTCACGGFAATYQQLDVAMLVVSYPQSSLTHWVSGPARAAAAC
jgi:hypothetical protein